MQPRYLIIFCLLISTFSTIAQEEKVRILLPQAAFTSTDNEINEIFNYFVDEHHRIKTVAYGSNEWKNLDLSTFDIIWLHNNDSTHTFASMTPAFSKAILDFVHQGGNLLLTQHALSFLNRSGLEPVPIQNRSKSSTDNGYGRMLGFHSFIHHPLFDSLHGGSYIWKPPLDTVVSQCGFFDDQVPENGKVIAVDWDYIFVREDAKLIVEYDYGQGKVLGIGAYFNLNSPNLNRSHFDLFYRNVFVYLSTEKEDGEIHFWNYDKPSLHPLEFVLKRQFVPPPARKWKRLDSSLELGREKALNEYCELAGKRILMASYEQGGIFELWAHPFMAFRDYQVLISFNDDTNSILLSALSPEISITPGSITRKYSIDNGAILEEIMSVSPDNPLGVIHYEYTGPKASIEMRYKSNMRMMWPYSEKVLKNIVYGYQPGFNAQEITAPDGGISTLIGATKIMHNQNMTSSLDRGSDSVFAVLSSFSFDLDELDYLDIVFAAGSEGRDSVIGAYMDAIRDPELVYQEASNHYEEVINKNLLIHSPDDNFNNGYAWSLAATDRFFVKTPGIGTSLVAGYNGTDRGWDGGHTVNGRPGYAWYFGRDAVWSAFAVLDYGDFDGVRQVLDLLIKYQDLSGKIFHELSTSGFVHYDASDATPLFIILAARYLEHSGDTAYIRKNWPAIQKALDFCYSTDTDGDGFIENTNVGHGWVEGGHLFGSHTSLYLASCWTEALDKAAYMASVAGVPTEAAAYFQHSKQLRDKITTLFYNADNSFLYQGIYKDGSFHQERSILPSIPIYFGQLPTIQSEIMLKAFASSDYTTDWGVRISPQSGEHYHPQGYHSGSVWPLFTGWVALAEYKQKRHVQGFGHIMSNLNIYKDFSLGYLEEVLNGEKYTPSGVCPHQCWSETMVLQPIIEGMLGLEPDAPKNKLRFSPSLPADWEFLNIRNIRVGKRLIHWEMKREENYTDYYFSGDLDGLDIYFEPLFPDGTAIDKILINGKEKVVNYCTACQGVTLKIILEPEGETAIRVFHKKGISLLAPAYRTLKGENSNGIRITNITWENSTYTIETEGAAANSYELKLINNYGTPEDVQGASYRLEGNKLILDINFPAVLEGYSSKTISVKF